MEENLIGYNLDDIAIPAHVKRHMPEIEQIADPRAKLYEKINVDVIYYGNALAWSMFHYYTNELINRVSIIIIP